LRKEKRERESGLRAMAAAARQKRNVQWKDRSVGFKTLVHVRFQRKTLSVRVRG